MQRMNTDRNLKQLEKRLTELANKERSLNVTLRVLREDRRREIERIDRLYDGKENHIEQEIKHVLHEIPNLERDLERRREEVEEPSNIVIRR